MQKLVLRPSLKSVRQIARIERFRGAWDRLSQSSVLASAEHERRTIVEGAESVFHLDTTAPSGLEIRVERENQNGVSKRNLLALESYVEAHKLRFELCIDDFCKLSLFLNEPHRSPAIDLEEEPANYLRTQSTSVKVRDPWQGKDKEVFPALGAFLAEQRLLELIDWAHEELEGDTYHPLYVIGIFHLSFLQISPFDVANQRIAFLAMWHMLVDAGYDFIRHCHVARVFQKNPDAYFAALRQAEKTAGGNWSTLNVWLEHFLSGLEWCVGELSKETERRIDHARLTGVQQQIVKAIRDEGAVTRDAIATETGINISTIKYNLGVLTNQGIIARNGAGRGTNYSAL